MRQIDSRSRYAVRCAPTGWSRRSFRHVTPEYRQSPRRNDGAVRGCPGSHHRHRRAQRPAAATRSRAGGQACRTRGSGSGCPRGTCRPGRTRCAGRRATETSCARRRQHAGRQAGRLLRRERHDDGDRRPDAFPGRVLGGPGQDEEHRQGRARSRAAPQRTGRAEHLRHGDRRGRQVRRHQRQGEGSAHRVRARRDCEVQRQAGDHRDLGRSTRR